MRRLFAPWLAACVIGSCTGPAPTAEPPPHAEVSTGPIVLGGRIEIPAQGFAIEAPDGWHAFDLTHPDLLAEMAAFSDTTRRLAADIPDMYAPLGGWHVLIQAPWDRARVPHECRVGVEPANGLTLEEWADMTGLGFGWAEIETEFVQLPAGPAHRQDRSGGETGIEEEVSFHIVEADRHAWLQCIDAVRHDDGWLSIAETFEFLPAEGEQ